MPVFHGNLCYYCYKILTAVLCLRNLSESYFATFSATMPAGCWDSSAVWNSRTLKAHESQGLLQHSCCFIKYQYFGFTEPEAARLQTWLWVQFVGTLGLRSKCFFSLKNLFVPSPLQPYILNLIVINQSYQTWYSSGLPWISCPDP